MAFQSKYFFLPDFNCHSGVPYPKEWIDQRLNILCILLDRIREEWGSGINVVCGYRTPEYNKALFDASEARAKAAGLAHGGVALNSEHCDGIAADIRPNNPTPARVKDLHDQTLSLYTRGFATQLGGLGLYPGWIHVDTFRLPSGILRRWGGQGTGANSQGR